MCPVLCLNPYQSLVSNKWGHGSLFSDYRLTWLILCVILVSINISLNQYFLSPTIFILTCFLAPQDEWLDDLFEAFLVFNVGISSSKLFQNSWNCTPKVCLIGLSFPLSSKFQFLFSLISSLPYIHSKYVLCFFF